MADIMFPKMLIAVPPFFRNRIALQVWAPAEGPARCTRLHHRRAAALDIDLDKPVTKKAAPGQASVLMMPPFLKFFSLAVFVRSATRTE
jgi:hypothetical protein